LSLEEKPVTTVCDEMSTTSNTDMSTDIPMSDPHWDGYTVLKLFFFNSLKFINCFLISKNSSYFCNLNNDNYMKFNKPILPWDGIFFELESNEESSSQKLNVS
jgi:hypothetical protein